MRINNSWAILGVLPVPVNEREEPWSERLQTRPRAQFWSSVVAVGMLDHEIWDVLGMCRIWTVRGTTREVFCGLASLSVVCSGILEKCRTFIYHAG